MSVIINSIVNNSPAFYAKIKAGSIIHSINGNSCNDIFDFDYYTEEQKLVFLITDAQGKSKHVFIDKKNNRDLGFRFENWMMSNERSCKNKCIFCFIDQMPQGCRDTLYFKDDDERLGFLYGNYITLTNLSDTEIDRIIKMKLSPVNISVHTMNGELRNSIMGNRFAGESLKYIDKLAKANTKMNFQLVLMPGINDGNELEFSLSKLTEIACAESIAVVPVGRTKFRETLAKLDGFSEKTAGNVIDIIDKYGDICFEKFGRRICYASDEFYILAGRDIPPAEFYSDFPQIENGVGLIADFLENVKYTSSRFVPTNRKIKKSIATGFLAYDILKKQLENITNKWQNLDVNVFGIKNDFFGETITVAGLVCASDIIFSLKDKDIGEELLIPNSMLRREGDVFLDNISVNELENSLGVPVKVCKSDGSDLLKMLFSSTK